MRAAVLALVVLLLSLESAGAQSQAEPIAPFSMDSCRVADAGPSPDRANFRLRRLQLPCSSAPLVAVTCDVRPVPGAYPEVLALCNQVSDVAGDIEYGCSVLPPEDGAREWRCSHIGSGGRIDRRWTWTEPVGPWRTRCPTLLLRGPERPVRSRACLWWQWCRNTPARRCSTGDHRQLSVQAKSATALLRPPSALRGML